MFDRLVKNSKLKQVFINYFASVLAFLLVALRDFYLISNLSEAADFFVNFITVLILSSLLSNILYYRIGRIVYFSFLQISYCILLVLVLLLISNVTGYPLSFWYALSVICMVFQAFPNGYFFYKNYFFYSKVDRLLSPILFMLFLKFDFEISFSFFLSVFISLFLTIVLSVYKGCKYSARNNKSGVIGKVNISTLIEMCVTILPNVFWREFLNCNPQYVSLIRVVQISHSVIMVFLTPFIRGRSYLFFYSRSGFWFTFIAIFLSLLSYLLTLKFNEEFFSACLFLVTSLLIFVVGFYLTKVLAVNTYCRVNRLWSAFCLFCFIAFYFSDIATPWFSYYALFLLLFPDIFYRVKKIDRDDN